jgi:hypothetical protein
MQEQSAPAIAPSSDYRAWPDWLRLALLVLLAAVIHAWMIGHTAVVARDSFGYIRYALMLEHLPWTEALPRLEQHPLYPLSILAVSLPLRHLLGGVSSQVLILSGQLASALAGILLVIPLYLLGKELFDRRVGFWAAALFQCLPICAQVTSDGLSDGVFLLLVTTALLWAVQALRRRSLPLFLLCGLATGLAYLTRPEGMLVVIATLVVLAGIQVFATQRWPWLRTVSCTGALLLGTGVVAVPYMAVIGGVSVKPGLIKIMHNAQPQDTLYQPSPDQTSERSTLPRATAASPLLASNLAIWWIDEQQVGPPSLSWGIKALVVEIAHGFHYVAFFPLMLGTWWFCYGFRRDPGGWVVVVLCLIVTTLLIRVAMGVHYLSERHTLILVLCGSIWAAAALVRIGDRLPELIGWLCRRPVAQRWHAVLTLGWLWLAIGWGLPSTLRPLHLNRLGHRLAGEWLAVHTHPEDRIVDPFCWAYFYAGRTFPEGELPAMQPGPHSISYVVVTENSKNDHLRLSALPGAKKLAEHGHEVFRWRAPSHQLRKQGAEEVVVYAVAG